MQFASIIGFTVVAKVMSAQAFGSNSVISSSTFVKQDVKKTSNKNNVTSLPILK